MVEEPVRLTDRASLAAPGLLAVGQGRDDPFEFGCEFLPLSGVVEGGGRNLHAERALRCRGERRVAQALRHLRNESAVVLTLLFLRTDCVRFDAERSSCVRLILCKVFLHGDGHHRLFSRLFLRVFLTGRTIN